MKTDSDAEQELIAARDAGRAAAANGQPASANPYQPATTAREGCLQLAWSVAWEQESKRSQGK